MPTKRTVCLPFDLTRCVVARMISSYIIKPPVFVACSIDKKKRLVKRTLIHYRIDYNRLHHGEQSEQEKEDKGLKYSFLTLNVVWYGKICVDISFKKKKFWCHFLPCGLFKYAKTKSNSSEKM